MDLKSLMGAACRIYREKRQDLLIGTVDAVVTLPPDKPLKLPGPSLPLVVPGIVPRGIVTSPTYLEIGGLSPLLADQMWLAMVETGLLWRLNSGRRSCREQEELIAAGATSTSCRCSNHVPPPDSHYCTAVDVSPSGVRPELLGSPVGLGLLSLVHEPRRALADLYAKLGLLPRPGVSGGFATSAWRWGGHFARPSWNHFDVGARC